MVDERTESLIEKIISKNAKLIAGILARGDRIELIPVKDNVKILQIVRREVKNKSRL